MDYRSEIDEINANSGAFERIIIRFIESEAPSIVVAEVGASVVEVVRVRGLAGSLVASSLGFLSQH